MNGFNPYFTTQSTIDRINNQIKDLENLRGQYQNLQHPQNNQVPITQNFQIAPAQNQSGIKYASSIEDVKNELVFTDTLFINKEHTVLWQKDASGTIKSYELREIVELDEKDRQIALLTEKLNKLEQEMNNNEYTSNVGTDVNAATTNEKSTSLSVDKPSKD